MKNILSETTPAVLETRQTLFRCGLSVEIDENTHKKIFGWCRAAETEVSFMMLVEKVGNVFKVYDALLAKQSASYAYVEFKPGEVANLMFKLHQWGRNLEHYRGYGHTHNDFSVFWSSTDVTTRDALAGELPWLLSIVINKRGDMLACVDMKDPAITIDNLPIAIVKSKRPKKDRNYKSDIAKYVEKMVWRNPQADIADIIEHTPTKRESTLVSRLWPGDWDEPVYDGRLDNALLKHERGEVLSEEESQLILMEIDRLEKKQNAYYSYRGWENYAGEIRRGNG